MLAGHAYREALLNVRRWTAVLIFACACVLGAMVAPAPANAAAANPAEAYVEQNVSRGYAILNNTSLSDEQRRMQFRNFILTLTDPRRIGMFTLGQYANGASKADIDAFVAAFTDYVVAVYESRLTKYKGQSLKVTGSVARAPDDIVVNTDVIDPDSSGGEPIKAAFRVRKTPDGRPIVTDIQVEGVWLAISERSDFTGFLQQHGGSIKTLNADLERQAAELRNSATADKG
jgi:phospholipid transport system substrate-binding protein